jgi:hypothetical protein
MFRKVKAFHFFFGRYPQTDCLLKKFKQEEGSAYRPCRYGENSKRLDTQEMETAAVKQAVFRIQQADHQSAKHTAGAVAADCPGRIVDLQLCVNEFNRSDYQDAGGQSDQQGTLNT